MPRNPKFGFLSLSPSIGSRRGGPSAMTITLAASLLLLNAPFAAAQAIVEYGHILAGATAGATSINKKIDSGIAKRIDTDLGKKIDSDPAKKTDAETTKKPDPTLSADSKPVPVPPPAELPEVSNRRALEQQAGKDAAKLTLKSAPPNAIVRIDGKPVGQTPLQLTLAPANYKVELEGPWMESGHQQVTLLPQETREVELSLSQPPSHPKQIRLQ